MVRFTPPLYFFAIFGARNSHTHQSLASVGHWKSKFVRSPTTFLLTAMAENEAMRRNRWLKILKKAVRFALPDCTLIAFVYSGQPESTDWGHLWMHTYINR